MTKFDSFLAVNEKYQYGFKLDYWEFH